MTDAGGTIQAPQGFVTRQELATVAATMAKNNPPLYLPLYLFVSVFHGKIADTATR